LGAELDVWKDTEGKKVRKGASSWLKKGKGEARVQEMG